MENLSPFNNMHLSLDFSEFSIPLKRENTNWYKKRESCWIKQTNIKLQDRKRTLNINSKIPIICQKDCSA